MGVVISKGEAKNLAKANRAAPAIVRGSLYGGQFDVGELTTLGSYLSSYERDLWVYRCANRIAKSAARLPLKVYQRRRGNARSEERSHPFAQLLRKPNPWQTGYELIEATFGYIELAGEAFWAKETNGTDRVQELYCLRPDRVKVVPSKDPNVFIAGYTYEVPSVPPVTYNADEIIHFKTFNPLNEFRGLSALSAAANSVTLDRYAMKQGQMFYKNNCILGAAVEVESTLSEESFTRLKTQIEARHQGANKAYQVGILEEGMKWKEMGVAAKDAQTIEMRKLTREEILAAFDMPPAMVGILEYANYANMGAQNEFYWEECMGPRIRFFENIVNAALASEFGDNIFAEFLTNEILRLNAKERMEIYRNGIQNGYMSPNYVLQLENLPPYVGGDQYYMPMNFMPVGQGEDSTKEVETGQKQLSDKRRRFVEAKAMMVRTLSKRYLKRVKGFFNSQEDRIIAKLPDYGKQKAIEIDAIFDMDEENTAIKEILSTLHYVAIGQGAQNMESFLGVTVDFSPEAERTQRIMGTLAEKVTRINETTKGELKEVIATAYERGYSVGQLVDGMAEEEFGGIRHVFDQISDYRAEMIARTELGSAYDMQNIEYMKEAGIETFDVVGCEDEETDCNRTDVPLDEVDSLEWHPNHGGSLVPSNI